MNNTYKILLAILTIASSAGCAVSPESSKNEDSEKYFRSWVTVQQEKHPEYLWERTRLGCYVLEEEAGTGAALGAYSDSPFLYISYTISDLDGNISETSEEAVAKQIKRYNPTYYYGPVITYRGGNQLYADLEEIFPRMNEGGRCRFVMPGWLQSAERYSSEAQYLKKVSGDNSIYDMTVVEVIRDIEKWELDSLSRYVRNTYGAVDTLKKGFYYIQLEEPSDSTGFTSGDRVYLNYTGSLTNGLVFDTTIERKAKDAGIYDSSKTYEPTYVTWADDYSEIKMGSDESEVVDGFAYLISLMKKGEKGIGIFCSSQGYQTTSKNSIPSYSPLIFEIELIGKDK